MDLGVSGLASGFDWKTFVEQMIDVQRAPERALQTDQSHLQKVNGALSSLKSQMGTLQTKAQALKDPTLFDQRTATVSDTTLASATATGDTAPGTYNFSVTQLARTASWQGTANAGAALSATADVSGVVLGSAGFTTPITAGKFTVDGKQVSIDTTDTLQQVFDKISTATEGAVTASYDPATDKITLAKASGELVIGNTTDTSNFLQSAKLVNSGSGSVTSALELGGVKMASTLNSANLATPLSGDAGAFKINGVSISWNSSERVSDVVARINNSTAGVAATYDATTDRFSLTNKATGDVGIAVEDTTGNFLAATGLAGGALQRGQDMQYKLNGGSTLFSRSNTITEDSSGIKGLSVNVTKTTGDGAIAFSVAIATDQSKIKTAINDFITEFNKTQTFLDTQTASTTDAKGKVTAGILAGDSQAYDIASQMRSIMASRATGLPGTLKQLDSVGITTSGESNNLTLTGESLLDNALTNNIDALKDLFTNSTSGLSAKFNTFLDNTIGENGSLVKRQDGLTKQIGSIDTQITDMERVLAENKATLTQSFVNMELAQSSIKAQLSTLQQNLGQKASS